MRAIITMEHDVRVIQDETIVRAVHDIAGITVDRDRLVLALTKASAFYEEGYRAGKKAADVAKVVHGRWEDTGIDELDLVYGGWKCSVCGYIFCGNKTNFCPDCGAKMEG